ncbi:hypothetical protein [Streptomyces tailanensis]|uniref:hypothetical protein n=1 Tax=Streptomyces tailanensis TaxID=2569858 RepID=UPI00122DC952|nr:hypothetical protein [Streptomyces tailanensis]
MEGRTRGKGSAAGGDLAGDPREGEGRVRLFADWVGVRSGRGTGHTWGVGGTPGHAPLGQPVLDEAAAPHTGMASRDSTAAFIGHD